MAVTYQSKGNGADGVSESEGEGDSVFSNPTLQLYLVRAPHSEPDLFRRARHGLVDFTYRRLEKLHVGRVTGGRSWRGRDSIGGSGAALSTPTTIGGVFLGLGHLWLERAWAAGGGGQRPARQAAMSENAAADTAVRLGGRVLAWPAVAHSAPQPPSRSPRRRRSREGY